MNLLLESLPKSLRIGRKEHPIKTDFRTWMQLNETVIRDDATEDEIMNVVLSVFENKRNKTRLFIRNGEEIVDQVSWFLRCGKEESSEGNSKGPVNFSFTYDSDYILSAFQQFYGIDLLKSDMHWWEFVALMNSISGECELKERVRLRSIDAGKIKDSKERARIRSIQCSIALPHNQRVMSDEDIGEALW